MTFDFFSIVFFETSSFSRFVLSIFNQFCQVFINEEPQETAIDFSIKAAEQLASEKTYKKLLEAKIITDEPENRP